MMFVVGIIGMVLLAAAGLWLSWAHTHDVRIYAKYSVDGLPARGEKIFPKPVDSDEETQ